MTSVSLGSWKACVCCSCARMAGKEPPSPVFRFQMVFGNVCLIIRVSIHLNECPRAVEVLLLSERKGLFHGLMVQIFTSSRSETFWGWLRLIITQSYECADITHLYMYPTEHSQGARTLSFSNRALASHG